MLSDEYYINRAKEIVKDIHSVQLLYMIGGIHKIDRKTVERDKNKKYFRELIIKYLKDET